MYVFITIITDRMGISSHPEDYIQDKSAETALFTVQTLAGGVTESSDGTRSGSV